VHGLDWIGYGKEVMDIVFLTLVGVISARTYGPA